MAFGRRLDSKRLSSNCSTTILIGFVTLCFLGVWMTTSPTIQPAGVSTSLTTSDIKKQVRGGNPKPFEDGSGDIPEEGNTNIMENTDVNESDEESVNTSPVKHNEGQTHESETNKNHGIGQDKIKEKSSEEAINSNQIGSNEQQQFDGDKESAQKEKADAGTVQDERGQGQIEEKVKQSQDKEVFPDVAQPELLKETNTQNGSWSTQETESRNEKEIQSSSSSGGQMAEHKWKICDATADYIPCLDNEKAIKALKSNMHYEHRERHCPEKALTCLVRLPDGYTL